MQRGCGCSVGGECASTESFARRIGVSHSTMHRRITEGSIDEYDADQWACRIGALPQNVWPDWGRVLHEPIEEPA